MALGFREGISPYSLIALHYEKNGFAMTVSCNVAGKIFLHRDVIPWIRGETYLRQIRGKIWIVFEVRKFFKEYSFVYLKFQFSGIVLVTKPL